MKLLALIAAFCARAAFAQVPMPPPQVPKAQPAAPRATRPPARASAAARSAAPSPKDLPYAAPRMPRLLPAVRGQLSNGVKLLLFEDHETPMVYGAALVRTGSVFDPPGRAGLAALTGALLRSGGTRLLDPGQFDAQAEGLGAVLESSIAETMATVSFSAPRRNSPAALALFRDLLTEPAFRADRLDLAKAAALNAVTRRNDEPRQLLRRVFFEGVYAKDSPSTRRPEYDDLIAIGRADIERFHRRYFFPANTTLVLSGDFDPAEMKGALETLFSAWKNDQPPVPDFPGAKASDTAGTYLATRTGVRDAFLAFGRLGTSYRDSDAAALSVAAAVLGGGPRSRLWKRRGQSPEISEVLAEATPGLGAPAAFAISAVTMTGAASNEVKIAIEELGKLRSAEPSAEELRAARDWVWLRTCEGLDNRWRAAFRQATAEYYGYPADYLSRYLTAVAAVTPADVLRVAKDRLDPAKFTLAVVSNWRTFDDPRGLPATPVDLKIPPARAASTPAGAAAAEAGIKILRRAQEAAGGADKLAVVQDFSMKSNYALEDGGNADELDQWIAPSTLRQDGNSTRFGRLIRFTDGEGGWVSNGYGYAGLNPVALKQAQGDLLRVYIPLLLSDRVPGRAISALDDRTVEISHGDTSVQVVFDPATGLPSELHYVVLADQGLPILVRESLSAYRDVNGIKLPGAFSVFQNGRKYADAAVSEIKLNQGLKTEVLQRRP